MERLSHDLNLALEESNCGKQGRRKFGLRRRTRSAGNLPACIIGITEDGSSSSPPQPPIISQVLSDSDDPQLNQLQQSATKSRATHFCPIGNIESDSFNENFSPTKPPNARRKRKFKKMAIEYSDNNSNGRISPSLLVGPSHINLVTNCSILNVQGPSPLALINKKKRIFKHNCQDGYRSNIFCGKRKWSHRERSEVGEMRERSFSGGCTSKSYFFSKGSPKSYLDFKNSKKLLPIDKVPKFKEKHGVVTKSAAVKNGIESALQTINLSTLSEKPMLGSSTFNFVYRCPTNKNSSADPASVIKIATELPPFFAPKENECNWGSTTKTHHKKHDKSHNGKHKSSQFKSNPDQLRNPLQFDDQALVMDCSVANELLSSSSLSSSDSEGVVTNDSDREGDDELTDWPGNEEISSFTKSLNFQKVQRPYPNAPFKTNVAPAAKPTSKKDKFLPKQGLSSCKNKTEAIFNKNDLQDAGLDMQLMDEDTMMSDSGSVLDTYACNVTRSHSDLLGPSNSHASFTSFSDVKNAGLQNNNANEAFFHSFQAFQDKAKLTDKNSEPYTPRSNFHLQKTSSSDLNLSEKSPQSDHCYSEHSACFGTPEIREIRAGCRRIRDERPGFTILSAANEQLSKFLRDPCQDELKLPCFSNDHEEKEKLACLAKLYSLELQVEMGRPVLRKTINTTQSVRMEHTRFHRQKLLSEFKRRCYGNDCNSDQVLDSLSPSLLGSVDLCKQSSSMEPDICLQSTSSAVNNFDPYASLTKASTIDDLSASQDYDQGFSEPAHLHDVGNLAVYKNGLESLRPDLLSHIPLGASLTDSSSIDLAELD